jgi:putative transposase
MQNNTCARLLAYVTGLVNQRLLLQSEYLIVENRMLRSHVSGRLRLSDAERSTLAQIGKRLGRRCLAEVACVAKPETILAWYRRLIARKFDGSKHRSSFGQNTCPRGRCSTGTMLIRHAEQQLGTVAGVRDWPG